MSGAHSPRGSGSGAGSGAECSGAQAGARCLSVAQAWEMCASMGGAIQKYLQVLLPPHSPSCACPSAVPPLPQRCPTVAPALTYGDPSGAPSTTRALCTVGGTANEQRDATAAGTALGYHAMMPCCRHSLGHSLELSCNDAMLQALGYHAMMPCCRHSLGLSARSTQRCHDGGMPCNAAILPCCRAAMLPCCHDAAVIPMPCRPLPSDIAQLHRVSAVEPGVGFREVP